MKYNSKTQSNSRFIGIILLILTFLAQSGWAQEKAGFNTIYDDLGKSGADAKFIGNKIGKLDLGDLAICGSVLAATGTAYIFDQDMRDFMQKHQSATADNIFTAARQGGEITYMAGLSGAVYLTGLLAGSDRTRKTGREMLEALALSGITTVLVKYTMGRSRPFTNNGKNDFRFFQMEDQFTSFSSGHTAVAFSLASVISGEFDNPWLSTVLYTVAAMTGVSRM